MLLCGSDVNALSISTANLCGERWCATMTSWRQPEHVRVYSPVWHRHGLGCSVHTVRSGSGCVSGVFAHDGLLVVSRIIRSKGGFLFSGVAHSTLHHQGSMLMEESRRARAERPIPTIPRSATLRCGTTAISSPRNFLGSRGSRSGSLGTATAAVRDRSEVVVRQKRLWKVMTQSWQRSSRPANKDRHQRRAAGSDQQASSLMNGRLKAVAHQGHGGGTYRQATRRVRSHLIRGEHPSTKPLQRLQQGQTRLKAVAQQAEMMELVHPEQAGAGRGKRGWADAADAGPRSRQKPVTTKSKQRRRRKRVGGLVNDLSSNRCGSIPGLVQVVVRPT